MQSQVCNEATYFEQSKYSTLKLFKKGENWHCGLCDVCLFYNQQLFQIVLAVVLVAASAQEEARDARLLAGIPAGYAGLPVGYAGLPAGYAGLPAGYAGLPAGYAGLPAAHAGYAGIPYPYAAPAAIPAAIPAPVPVNYALPPVREVEGAPIVSQTVEKVEQHGYSIRY